MEKEDRGYKPVSFIRVFIVTLYVWVTLAIITGIIVLLLLVFTDFNFKTNPKYNSYEDEKYKMQQADEAIKSLEQSH